MKSMAYWTMAFSIVEIGLIVSVLLGKIPLAHPGLLLNSALLCGQSSMFYLQHMQKADSLWFHGVTAFAVLTLFGFCAVLIPLAIHSSWVLLTCVGIACSILNAISVLLVLDAFWLSINSSSEA